MITNLISYAGNFFRENIYSAKDLSEEGCFIVEVLTGTVLMGTLAYGCHLVSKNAGRNFEASCQKMHPPLREVILLALKIQLFVAVVIGSLVGILAYLSCPIPYGIVRAISLFTFVVSFLAARDELISERLKEK